MNNFEIDLLNNPNKLSFMNNLLKEHQFSEELESQCDSLKLFVIMIHGNA